MQKDDQRADHIENTPADPASVLSPDTLVVCDELRLRMVEKIPNLAELLVSARRASDFEHQMKLLESFKLYPKAVLFSMIISIAIVMEGYDLTLIASFFGYPTFREKFGVRLADGSYQVTPHWQSGLQNGAQVGEILGLVFAGLLADRFGYKMTLLGALVMIICTIFVLFFAQNIGMLFAGEVLCGLPWGAFQTLTTTYAAEVSPIALRSYLTTYVNLCWGIGSIIATGVLRSLLRRSDEWAWRIPYAIQWFWPVLVIIGVSFAPESPWWLIRKGRLDEAKRSLRSLTSHRRSSSDLDDTISFMVVTNEHEKFVNDGVSYWDCFKGVDRRRTEVVCVVWMVQVLCGVSFSTNIAYFMEQAGLPATTAFDFGVGLVGLGLTGTVCFWFVMQYVGRRTLYVWGLAIMLTILLIVGFLGIPAAGDTSIAYASGALLLVFVFVYGITVGPACYSLVSELPSTRLRIKSVVIARNCYNIVGIAGNFLQAAILNRLAWNLRGKGAFIWCIFCGISFVWTYFRLPEPTGRSSAELDLLFEQKIPARKFSKIKVDPF
ncbi:general substrate transporter [Lipomyces doorenjongii]|uniref:general substrate transporter n=1 Tax=Lipomyces doorenjongii TaxID=383834 RepID=UPI0034CE5EFF